ncbi:hypothetical protein N9A86_00035 [Akkermansiaceae bacterium]|nr:hypothetical protein [Akkermansiaceae bacterium]MDB4537013.1 hypothetical protein [Akkermansiaceae bacterium]MDB4544847.1 hypothetical protein [Akkermansiaceae bacterium]
MKRLFLCSILLAGLSSCSSMSTEAGDGETAQQSKVGKEYSLNSKNPFEWSNDDVQKAKNGTIEGGKRSQYDSKGSSQFAKKGSPSYLSKSYTKEAWKGSKNYSTGSYQTSRFGESGKQSWFSNKKSGANSKVARASGQSYETGSYQTGAASEAGRAARSGSSAYVDSRREKFGWTPEVFDYKDHRRLSMGDAKSLLKR